MHIVVGYPTSASGNQSASHICTMSMKKLRRRPKCSHILVQTVQLEPAPRSCMCTHATTRPERGVLVRGRYWRAPPQGALSRLQNEPRLVTARSRNVHVCQSSAMKRVEMETLPLPAGSWAPSRASQLRVMNVGLALTTPQRDLGCASGIRRFAWVRGQRGTEGVGRVDPFTSTSSRAVWSGVLTMVKSKGAWDGLHHPLLHGMERTRRSRSRPAPCFFRRIHHAQP